MPRQEIDTEQQQAMCRQLAFNVWHAIADHRPLGGINRLRREVYPISAAWRQQAGGRTATGNSLTGVVASMDRLWNLSNAICETASEGRPK